MALYTKKREVYEYKCGLTEKYNSTMHKANKIDDTTKRKEKLKKAELIFEEMAETDHTLETIEE